MTVSILVARLDSLGDVLLSGPAIRAAAAGVRGEPARVTLLCGPEGEPAARMLPGVSEVEVWSCPWIRPNPDPVRQQDICALTERLSALRLDVAVLLTSDHQSCLPLALVLRMAGVPVVVGISADYPGSLLDVRLRPGVDFDDDAPEPERALAVAAAAGCALPQGDDGALAVGPLPEVPELVGAEPYVVLHPGASVPARVWPAQRCRAAVYALRDKGKRVLVTGGPAERELTAAVAGDAGEDLGGRLSVAELAAVLAGADVLVAGNTGPAHLAAAVGTPVVSLFAPVVPAARWAPYRVPHQLLGDQHAPCRGTRARICPVPGHPCLAGVPVGAVVEAVETVTGVRA
jgi:ADP-heptose:LPS heptosyltransferase